MVVELTLWYYVSTHNLVILQSSLFLETCKPMTCLSHFMIKIFNQQSQARLVCCKMFVWDFTVLIILLSSSFSEAILKCDIIKNADPGAYSLPTHLIDATRRSNISDNYQVINISLSKSKVNINCWSQVFDCSCPADNSGREGFEVFGDSMKKELDTYYYSKDERDWAESQMMRVSNCNRLVVSLGGAIIWNK